MQIVATTVDQTTFGQPQANPPRVDTARALIEQLAGDASLLVLPAGYLRAKQGASEAEVLDVARPVVADARRAGLGLVLGVDSCGVGWAADRDVAGLVARGALPMWAVAWTPGQRRALVWRQRSTSSTNATSCDPASSHRARTLTVQGRKVEVVLCGEGFNHDLRDGIVMRAWSLTAVVLVAHTAAGARHWQTQRYLSTELGLPTLRAVHSHDRATNAEGLRSHPAPREHALDLRAGPPWIAPVAYTFRA